MGMTGPHDYPNDTITGGLVNPKRLFKRLAAVAATGLLALGLVAGTATASSAGGASSGDVGGSVEIFGVLAGGSSGDVGSASVASSGDVAK